MFERVRFPHRLEIRVAIASAVALAALASIATAASDGEQLVDYLFVQNAASARIADGVLTLGGVNADTLYFSDRPDRIVGRVTSREFVSHWASGRDSFEADPPNAVLTILDGAEPQDITVELRNPRFQGRDLAYDVKVLEGSPTASGGASSLFIDLIGRPATPMSYAGAARRATRRVVRY